MPNQCSVSKFKSKDPKLLFNLVKNNIGAFSQANGQGVILLVYSAMLTRGLDNIVADFDLPEGTLLNEHGYVSQELVNVMCVGRAAANLHDGDKDLGDNFILKGIHNQSDVGFLSYFEYFGYF